MAEDKERFTRLRDGRLVRYSTHEEFDAALRRLGIPVKDVTPRKGEERKHDIFLFQGPDESKEEED